MKRNNSSHIRGVGRGAVLVDRQTSNQRLEEQIYLSDSYKEVGRTERVNVLTVDHTPRSVVTIRFSTSS